ncbi:hypothetical protein CEXT_199311 [Caerostris extrusa]|uniref:Uncharacterized protein n=1 Tax=Caerostris extrusa TaxID=172846 RepID=A0AAV4WS14_CAEEX|nr:hypothetical protein CEXT_199311 [Caerostris extrusa]
MPNPNLDDQFADINPIGRVSSYNEFLFPGFDGSFFVWLTFMWTKLHFSDVRCGKLFRSTSRLRKNSTRPELVHNGFSSPWCERLKKDGASEIDRKRDGRPGEATPRLKAPFVCALSPLGLFLSPPPSGSAKSHPQMISMAGFLGLNGIVTNVTRGSAISVDASPFMGAVRGLQGSFLGLPLF